MHPLGLTQLLCMSEKQLLQSFEIHAIVIHTTKRADAWFSCFTLDLEQAQLFKAVACCLKLITRQANVGVPL